MRAQCVACLYGRVFGHGNELSNLYLVVDGAPVKPAKDSGSGGGATGGGAAAGAEELVSIMVPLRKSSGGESSFFVELSYMVQTGGCAS